ncbi:MAG: TRAP transporter TatT component family protein [Limisphaerales bacterium]
MKRPPCHLPLPHLAQGPLRIVALALLLGLVAGNTGCSVKRLAINQLGDALSNGGGTFATDDDPELIRDAAPFSLKLMESLLVESPQHRELLQALASGFTQYAYAFAQLPADAAEEKDLAAAGAGRERAKRLYLRARTYGLRGLEARHPGFENLLRANPAAAVRVTKKAEVHLLYWTAASWAAGISLSKDSPDAIADLPLAAALMDRALALDEKFDHGAIHSFLITFELARPGAGPDAVAKSRQHFARAVELSGGNQAGPYVSLAENVAMQQQNAAEFKALLEKALAVKVDTRPEWRLVNTLMQRRAKWLLGRMDDLILPALPPETKR